MRDSTSTTPSFRADLEMYVFSNEFSVPDPRTNPKRTVERTQTAERHMFYQQVFNAMQGPATR